MAALGLYGVINYNVSQRTQEIGIRMALGAETRQVLRLIIGQGVRMTIAGIAIGFIAAFYFARLLSSQLFQVSSFDPVTFVFTGFLLFGISVLASYAPARKATRIDPNEACRYE